MRIVINVRDCLAKATPLAQEFMDEVVDCVLGLCVSNSEGLINYGVFEENFNEYFYGMLDGDFQNVTNRYQKFSNMEYLEFAGIVRSGWELYKVIVPYLQIADEEDPTPRLVHGGELFHGNLILEVIN